MRPKSGCRIAPNWPYIGKMSMTSQFPDMTSSPTVFDVALFLLPSLITGANFMSTSSLVLELRQSYFIRNWPEIRKSEISPSEFCPIFGDWGESGIPNFGKNISNKMFLDAAKCQDYSFYRSWVIKGTHYGWVKLPPNPPTPWSRLELIKQKNQVFSRNITHSVTEFNSWDVQHSKWLITLKLSDGPQIKQLLNVR